MEAKIGSRKIIERIVIYIDKVTHLEYTYKSVDEFNKHLPSLLVITYDGQLTDDVVKSVIDNYDGKYPVYHTFKTDKLYLSDITLYMKELFNIESKEVING